MSQHLIFTASEEIGYIGRDDDTEDFTNLAHSTFCGRFVKQNAKTVFPHFKVITHFLPSNFGSDSIDCPGCVASMKEIAKHTQVFPRSLSTRNVIETETKNDWPVV